MKDLKIGNQFESYSNDEWSSATGDIFPIRYFFRGYFAVVALSGCNKIWQQGDPIWFIGCRENSGNSFALNI